MPNFIKVESELETRLDKWLYFIKYLEDFQSIPAIFKDEVFVQAFEKAALANLGQSELEKYEMNLKIYRDYKNTVDTAFDEGKLEGKIEGKLEGKLEGKIEGKIETATQLKNFGVDLKIIAKATGLTEEEIEKL
jgi:predicted transposase/invertase (TIGR01784 family)